MIAKYAMLLCPPILQHNKEIWKEMVDAILDAIETGGKPQWTPTTGDYN